MTLCSPNFCPHNNCMSPYCRKQPLPTHFSTCAHYALISAFVSLCVFLCKARPDNRRLCLILEECEVTANPQTWGHCVWSWTPDPHLQNVGFEKITKQQFLFPFLCFSLQNTCWCTITPVGFRSLGRCLKLPNQVRGVADSARGNSIQVKGLFNSLCCVWGWVFC